MEEKVFFKTSDGVKLCGILSEPEILRSAQNEKRKKCISFCHGITVDKDENGNFKELSKEYLNVANKATVEFFIQNL